MTLQPAVGTRSVASPNFGFLASTDPLLVQHAARAERFVFDAPDVALVKLRQFGEGLAQQAAARTGLYTSPDEAQVELLRRLRDGRVIDYEVGALFHSLRKAGNLAVHHSVGGQREALHQLRLAWKLAVWFQRAFVDPRFKSGAFVAPPDPAQAEQALRDELEQLRRAAAEHEARALHLAATVSEEARLRAEAEARSRAAYEELNAALELAEETEAQAAAAQAALDAQLAAVQAQAAEKPAVETEAVIERAQRAAEQLDLDESDTRLLIDAQLREAGWEADSVALTYKAGARPSKGRNLAIAEWPTASGPADYVLFAGLTPVGVVEAKRKRKDVAGAIEQAKRYSRGWDPTHAAAASAPWGDFHVPFLFATNGRPFLRQIKTKSGIWFLDARRPTNHSRPLDGWRTPQGLLELLAQDIAGAEERLARESSDYLPLRDYQRRAIHEAEAAIAAGQQDLLVAMATGTGKTRTALCLIYRLLKAGRFRRILFLVDRTALGEQAEGAFQDVRLESLQSLNDIYDVKGLGDLAPEADTRLHVATVQGMVKRILYPSQEDRPVPVDWYDCVVVDECHRGYSLDREMSETELIFRSEADYISKYRRVLDHFDAVRVGLTATPALHTTELFGAPVYEYGYRQAVIDGHLVDHEPPIRIRTTLNEGGIHWKAGEEVEVYDSGSGQLEMFRTPDEIAIEVDGFNTRVVTESFNRVVCKQLAHHIDPSLQGKTLIFCATDAHADMVVDLLKAAFAEAYGEALDDAVIKITGAADKPLDKLRRFKTERLPNVAVTVDLLTTGVDVPEIVNLVFIRRVRSRILYEQMLGRATRLCDEIGKETFRVFDAVDLYAALKPYTAMQPVVTRPHLTYEQLVGELLNVEDPRHKASVLDELLAKLQAKKRHLSPAARQDFQTAAGASPEVFIDQLKKGGVAKAVELFTARKTLPRFLDELPSPGGRKLLVSQHEDELTAIERGYGEADKPEDYLAGFKAFLQENANALAALTVVTQRPRDLTRQQLRELKLQLDAAGYTETNLRTAWAEVSNQDIAASIIGFIRQQALGSPLVPYDQRIQRAVSKVLASRPWTPPQRSWLQRIAKQLERETIVDRDSLDRGQFQAEGGFNRLNKIFGGQLEAVLADLHAHLWEDVG